MKRESSDNHRPVRVEEVDWSGVFAWTRLRVFRMAVQPSRLLLALLLVLLCYLGGKVLDFAWGARAYPGEVAQYAMLPTDQYQAWRTQQAEQIISQLRHHLRGKGLTGQEVDDALAASDRFARVHKAFRSHYDSQQERARTTLSQAEKEIVTERDTVQRSVKDGRLTTEAAQVRLKRLDDHLAFSRQAYQTQRQQIEERRLAEWRQVRQLQPRGVFEVASQFVLNTFDRGVHGAATLNFGLADWYQPSVRASQPSVVGALRDVFVTLPGWLYRTHLPFTLVFMLGATVLWSILGGAIARLAALDATQGRSGTSGDALEFSLRRFVWFFLTPLFPLLGALLLGLVLMLGGLVFFNAREVWVLDLVGGVLFGFAIAVAFLIALLLIFWAGAAHLFYPALAVEGTDSFDAVSRAFGYLIARPWQWLFYTLVSMVYFAVTYLFVGMVLFFTLSIAQKLVRVAVLRDAAAEGVNRFDAMLPAPRLGQLVHQVEWSLLDTPGKIAAALIWVWVFVTVCMLAAYAISFYVNAHTWIYLLLRRSVDGTDYDEVYLTPQTTPALEAGSAPADKVEPASPAPTSPEASAEALNDATGDATGEAGQAPAEDRDDSR